MNVQVTTYDGSREVQIGRNSGIEELSDGVGNVPAADPGGNEQLDNAAAADGGSVSGSLPDDGDDLEQLKPKVVMTVREKEESFDGMVPHDLVVGVLARDGHDPVHVEDALSRAKQEGTITEPKTEHYRSV